MEPSFISQAGGVGVLLISIWLLMSLIEFIKSKRHHHDWTLVRVGMEPVYLCKTCGSIDPV